MAVEEDGDIGETAEVRWSRWWRSKTEWYASERVLAEKPTLAIFFPLFFTNRGKFIFLSSFESFSLNSTIE